MRHRFGIVCLAAALAATGCSRNDTPPVIPPPVETAPRGPAALQVVAGDGTMQEADYGQQRSCTFTVKNVSGKPVTVRVVDKSCACAGAEVKKPQLGPNEQTEIVLNWVPKLDQLEQPGDAVVRVWADVQAGDAESDKLRLEAKGRIKPTLFVNLPRGRLDFGRLDLADLNKHKELAIEVYTHDPAQKGFTLEPRSSSPGLQIVPPTPPRLTADRLAALKAEDGYRITLRCAEGLPVGRFREIVRLKSSAYPQRDLEVAVEGTVESGAFSVTPPAVQLPEKINLARGYRCPPLEISLRGEPKRSLKVLKVEPKFLQVEVEPSKTRDNAWQVRVSIPAGEAELLKHVSPQELEELVSFGFEAGGITFQTDHTLLPTVRVEVSGAQLQR